MGKLFGTDGVRGIVSTELNIDLAMKIGVGVARILKKNDEKLTFLIGSDTRISKDILKLALASGIMSEGADVIDLGVIPTPAVSYLIKKYNASGGFVISASHNPSEYNGIKVFNNEGFKLDDDIENKIEDIILNNFELTSSVNNVGKYEYKDDAKKDYVDYLKSTVDTSLSNFKVGIDPANGAAFQTSKMLFDSLGIEYMIINDNPDGLNINKNCGSTHLESLIQLVVDNNLDCGIAYDGDADRCLMIDNEGNVVDGDKILAIYGKYLKNNSKLNNNTIVGTVMSNLGLVKFCEKENINFESTKVGDRYVLENMLENNYVIGGEQSGHIIFKEYSNTGDGELTSIQMLMVMAKENKNLKTLANIMEKYPQVLKNVKVSRDKKEGYKNNSKIKKIIEETEKELNREGRVLVRASGTENLIRVMLEGKDIAKIEKMCNDISGVVEKELN